MLRKWPANKTATDRSAHVAFDRSLTVAALICPTPGEGKTCGARAFTLIELAIVMSLLILLAGFAWPVLQNRIRASELPESAKRLRSALFMARSGAVMEHRRYRIRFVPEVQQAIVEYEPDPIFRPGAFEPAPEPWAREPILLADVQVHEIQIGRPVWTKPLSTTDEAGKQDEEEEKKAAEEDTSPLTGGGASFFLNGATDDAEEFDELRPPIVFEADGSTEWAVLILARVDPEEELEEEEEQLWVLLDGRTGLATVREQVTEEQLSDPEFYVEREKLELPDLVDIDSLSFQVDGDPLGLGAMAGGLGGPTAAGQPGGPGGLGPNALGDFGGGRGGADSGGGRGGGSSPDSGDGDGSGTGSGDSGASDDPLDDLEEELDGSDLDEDEQEDIREAVREQVGR